MQMDNSEEPQDKTAQESEEQKSPTTSDAAYVWREFLLSRGVQDLLSGLNNLIQLNIKTKSSTTRWTIISALVWTIILSGIIIGPVAWLSWSEKISSDAATFLFGTIIGAAFTFLSRFLFKSG